MLGAAVNVASRIEGLTKSIGERVLATGLVAEAAPDLFVACGRHDVRGVVEPIDLFGLSDSIP